MNNTIIHQQTLLECLAVGVAIGLGMKAIESLPPDAIVATQLRELVALIRKPSNSLDYNEDIRKHFWRMTGFRITPPNFGQKIIKAVLSGFVQRKANGVFRVAANQKTYDVDSVEKIINELKAIEGLPKPKEEKI